MRMKSISVLLSEMRSLIEVYADEPFSGEGWWRGKGSKEGFSWERPSIKVGTPSIFIAPSSPPKIVSRDRPLYPPYIRIGYGTYNIFNRYAKPGDPLKDLLDRRGASVDWVVVMAKDAEIEHFRKVAKNLIKIGDKIERRVAEGALEELERSGA